METVDEEAAFARLQELYDQLPERQRQGEQLAQAVAAAEVVRCEAELHTARTLLEEAEAHERAARAALDEALASGDDALVDARRRAHLHAGSLLGFRIGPAKNAETALARALEEGDFATAEAAHGALMDEDARAALQAEVEAYRTAYAEALEVCERLGAADE